MRPNNSLILVHIHRMLKYFATGLTVLVVGHGHAHAGEVSVSFVEPQRYTDIGFGHVPRERNLKTLNEHMTAWANRLPAAQSLKIEVLDVDLAGMERPFRSDPFVRMLDGRVDGPRMTLRWTLSEGATVLASGRDDLSDMGYLNRVAVGFRNEPLFYDLRMLDDWLRHRVIGRAASR